MQPEYKTHPTSKNSLNDNIIMIFNFKIKPQNYK